MQTHRLCQPVPKSALEAINTLESIIKLKSLTTIVLSILCQNVIMTDSQTSKYYVQKRKGPLTIPVCNLLSSALTGTYVYIHIRPLHKYSMIPLPTSASCFVP